MTEAEWLACEEEEEMFATLRAWVSSARRKWRLLALACLEQFRPHFPHRNDYSAVLEMIARDSEEEWTFDERLHALEMSTRILRLVVDDASEQRWHYVAEALAEALNDAVQHAWEIHVPFVASRCCAAAYYLATGGSAEARTREGRHQARLIREIFGNPFRPVPLDPLWLTSDVQALARGIYEERAFDRMPILADALQDAGCTNEDVLNHCRDANAAHVRGCWVLDLLLGKG
jgi:hypothetical protein